MIRRRIPAALAAAALVLSACTGTVRRPDIELEGVQVGSVGLSGGTLIANVRVHNPNRFTLRANNLRYRLDLRRPDAQPGDSAWTRFADGVYPDTLNVRAGQTRTFPIPVSVSFAQLSGVSRAMLGYGRVDYRATGTVDVRTPIGTREVPFHKIGSVMMGR